MLPSLKLIQKTFSVTCVNNMFFPKTNFKQFKDFLCQKLSIPANEPILNEQNQPLMQKICSRLIGNESNEFPPKQINSYFLNYLETVDNLIFLDPTQTNVLKILSVSGSEKFFNSMRTEINLGGPRIIVIVCIIYCLSKY